VLDNIRSDIEKREREALSEFATCASDSTGRPRYEEQDPVRTCFQRDRDRVLHCKSFRRLKHKTQVFIDPQGDHYRTRLTHTLEVGQIARTIGRALRLNEDLIEAIALGHDVGHTPFGHAGERALDEAIRSFWEGQGVNPDEEDNTLQLDAVGEPLPKRFRHFEQSLRIVDVLEALNLSEETRLGINGHSKGRKDLTFGDGEPISTLEAAVVRISDRIAYLNHDIDDALRSGIIREVPSQFDALGTTYSQRIGILVHDAIQQSSGRPFVRISSNLLALMNDLKEWMFEKVYLRYPEIYPDINKAELLVKDLFVHYMNPDNLPDGYTGIQGAIDYVAGMTDRFAVENYEQIKLPSSWTHR
jgi:dGTPase